MNKEALHYSYVDILKQELRSRISSNPSYSLRAFSRDLSISPTQVSLVLNGKKGLSEMAARKIAQALAMSPLEAKIFCNLVLASDSKSKAKRLLAQKNLNENSNSQVMALDAFRVISDWYHFAILELTMQKKFVSKLSYFQEQLGISQEEAEQALGRLERLDLIENVNGKWRQTEANLSTVHDVPSDAIKKFHQQVLQKALQSITQHSVAVREINSLFIGIDQKSLPLYQKMVRKFHQDMNRFAEINKKNRSHVYCLSTQFFPLSKGDQS